MGKDIHYTIPQFFEERMKKHAAVADLVREDCDIYIAYRIKRRKFGDSIKIYFSDSYLFTESDFDSLLPKLKINDFVLIAKPESSYTGAAKEAAKALCIGVGKLGELMGALNTVNMWEYLTPAEQEQKKKRQR